MALALLAQTQAWQVPEGLLTPKDTLLHKVYKPLPILPDSMTYEEFRVLHRQIGWRELVTDFFVPGYVSFIADEPGMGWTAVFLRTLGAGLMAYGMYVGFSQAGAITDPTRWPEVKDNLIRAGFAFSGGMGLEMLGMTLDVAWGSVRLEEKQAKILYKYRRVKPSADWR